LSWLAHFHARFLDEPPKGLWESGTYWHLETRPEELKVLDDKPLKKAALKIDQVLKDCPYQTLVHGDAKVANFCFSQKDSEVAAVDFQYVGKGCGMKDLAYFVGSCLSEKECESKEQEILEVYFSFLSQALKKYKIPCDMVALEKSWREMYFYAWTDFHRFLKGWSPGHWKINGYSEKVKSRVLSKI
jgi:Ser/Thr protein kinase RdoA (MazF antagonist)